MNKAPNETGGFGKIESQSFAMGDNASEDSQNEGDIGNSPTITNLDPVDLVNNSHNPSTDQVLYNNPYSKGVILADPSTLPFKRREERPGVSQGSQRVSTMAPTASSTLN